MKIKTRLLIAFLIIVLVPTLSSYIFLTSFGYYHLKLIQEKLNTKITTEYNILNPAYSFHQLGVDTFASIQHAIVKDPSKFGDVEFLNEINEMLLGQSSYLMVTKQASIIYNGSGKIDKQFVDDFIEVDGDSTEYDKEGTPIFLGGAHEILMRKAHITFADGSDGSLIMSTDIESLMPRVATDIFWSSMAYYFILISTSGLLMYWIYKGIGEPIARLKVATQNITEGNLDFQLEIRDNNEVGKLCSDFETMRERLKIQAEEKILYDRQSKELISNISHDLKTPITAVIGYVEGIMDGVADTPEKMERYIQTIYTKANEMDRLINELTFYSKIDTNRIPYTFTKIKVSQFFNDCIEEVKFDLESENIELAYFNYADEATQIIADSEQLRRVMYNIIGNSIKYMDKKKGFINVRITNQEGAIQIEVEDNGRGIAAKDLPFIFDRFYRTDTSRNSNKGGSGIGLSIVKKIMEDHGGEIRATSKEGIGTVMYLKLRKYQEASFDE